MIVFDILSAREIGHKKRRDKVKFILGKKENETTKITNDVMLSIPSMQEDALSFRDDVMSKNLIVKSDIESSDSLEEINKALSKL